MTNELSARLASAHIALSNGDVAKAQADLEWARAALGQGEAVAWVRWHPKHGYAWGTIHPNDDGIINGEWRSVPLYTHAPQPVVPEGLIDRIKAAEQRIADGHAPRRIPADPTDVDLVLAEVRMFLTGHPQPFWIAAAPTPEAQPQGANPGSSTPTSEGQTSEAGQGVDTQAAERAYGYLWHANHPEDIPPGTPHFTPDRSCIEARKELRDLLTREQRGRGINWVRQMLLATHTQEGRG